MAKIAETPLMVQYLEMKKKHPDAILLFRVGDFYETFSEDAIAASEILGITLTRRANGSARYVELAGFPHHALDTYLPKLVRAGRRVAICEQLEDPKLTKKLVKRGITELVTPGVNTNSESLPPQTNNYLAGVHIPVVKGRPSIAGVAFLDITTGEFLCSEGTPEYVDKLLNAIRPAELLRMNGTRQLTENLLTYKCATYELDDWVYTTDAAVDRLTRQFSTVGLKGFGIEKMNSAVIAAGSLLHYLDITAHNNLSHLTSISRIEENSAMRLDPFTMRNLEILEPMAPEGKSLLATIDRTQTPMGARLLRRWLAFPLLDCAKIEERQNSVEYFFRDLDCRDRVRASLGNMGDLQRLISRVSTLKASPRDLLQLRAALNSAMELKRTLQGASSKELNAIGESMEDCSAAASAIGRTIHPDAPVSVGKGNVIAEGFSARLDELRFLSGNTRRALEQIRLREIEATGIPSLKLSFNNVFGYYLEVTNTHRDKVPETWIRRQTLVNAERYITPELKQLEEAIVNAGSEIEQIESEVFHKLIQELGRCAGTMQSAAAGCAAADVLLSFATVAADSGYVRPKVDDSRGLEILEGRHPVIEKSLPPGVPYISNSVTLDNDTQQIIMLTGPNMSGKSALLRQTALIVLMAQAGSFVPAEGARIGLTDKIFTRVGASDNLSTGESTFMSEMNEAAAIMNNMSDRSLILFDELGRGTSTYDGISIAWAIVEHIHENGRFRPKTLFATHYHELNEMEKSFKRIANYNVSVREIDGKVVFLRKLARGGSEHSFGIHVAKLAGMPPSIVKRADQVLARLEQGGVSPDAKGSGSVPPAHAVANLGQEREGYQLSFFQLDDPMLSQIRDAILDIDIDNLTPLQSLQKLHELKGLLTGK